MRSIATCRFTQLAAEADWVRRPRRDFEETLMKSARRRVCQSGGRAFLGVVLLLIAWASPANLFAAGGDLDPTFDPGTGANSDIRAIALQPDGKIIIGGAFTDFRGIERNHIARLSAEGSVDVTFDFFGTGTDDVVYAIALQADGKVLIGGAFTTARGVARNRIARLNTDGSLDTTFDPGTGAGGEVRGIVVQPDNKIVIVGAFTSYNGTARNRIARLNPDGSLDTTFDPGTGASGSVFAIAAQPDGKFIIGGLFTSYNGTGRNRIARINSNGSLSITFVPGAGADFNVFAVAVQSDGGIVIGGLFSTYDGVARNGIAGINPDGSLDDTFDPGTGSGNVYAVAVQSDDKVTIGGFFASYNGVTRAGIARINTDGSLDPSFDPGTGTTASSFVYAVAVQTDGRILLGGTFTTYDGVTRSRIARALAAPGALSFSAATSNVNEGAGNATLTLTRTGGTDNSVSAKVTITDGTASPADYIFAPGALDPSFNPGTGADSTVFAVAVQPDGKVILAGLFTTYNGVARKSMARIDIDGSLDTSFNPGTGASSGIYAMATQPDGKIMIGGVFSTYQGISRNRIARVDASGSLDTTFDPGTGVAPNSVGTIVVQPDGKILIGGDFTTYNGFSRNGIARLNPNGSLDTTFDSAVGADGPVNEIVVQPDGKIFIGGFFSNYNNVSRNRVARVKPDGSLDTTFDPGTGASGAVSAAALQPDSKILIGGNITTYNGVARKNLARINSDGSLDLTFDPGTGGTNSVFVLTLQPDGQALIGGNFTTYNGVTLGGIARINSNGSLDTTFDPGTGTDGTVNSIVLHPEGAILVGGLFTTYNGVAQNGIFAVAGDLFATWAAGDATDKNFQLPIVDDSLLEGSETLNLTLSNFTGGAIAGANTTQTLTVIDNDSAPTPTPSPTPTTTPTPTPTPTSSPTPTPSSSPTPTPSSSPTPTPGTLGNISTRLSVQTGDNVLIGGFIVTGTQSKRVLIRAIGPSLPIAGKLANPTLELVGSSGTIVSNDDWRSFQETEIIATTIPPSNDLESAIVATLPANNSAYTAIVRGVNNGTGIALVEAYDLDQTVDSKLANISTRGLVQTGDNVMIGGVIVVGTTPRKVIVRAIGPSLPVPGALADPTLELYDINGMLLISNDNWRDTQEAEIIATTIPPTDDLESAIVQTLAPAAYTAIVRGTNNATGIGLVEAYALEP